MNALAACAISLTFPRKIVFQELRKNTITLVRKIDEDSEAVVHV